MLAMCCDGSGKVRVVPIPDPQPDEKSVIVRVHASAVCGSELHALKGAEGLRGPVFNAGHEVAGVIEWAPKDSKYKPGMRVGARVVQGCGQCRWCAAGDETACPDRVYYTENGHSELFKLGLGGIQMLPDDVGWPEAAILSGDGLGVPARAARRLGDTKGKKVLVVGLGPVGLSCALVQAFRGARVAGADVSAYRNKLVKEMGAEQSFDASQADLTQRVMDWTDGLGADIVILAVARQESLQLCFDLVRRHGTVFQVAELELAQLNFSKSFLRREATMMGSWYYTSEDWPFMLDLHRKGLPYKKLITHVLPLPRAQEGIDAFIRGESGKVILKMRD